MLFRSDKCTRNEILTSNEIRQIIGMKPSDDPKADQLVNSNISQSKQAEQQWMDNTDGQTEDEGQNGESEGEWTDERFE